MHELALESRRKLSPAVDDVPGDRVTDEREVDPQLVSAAGQQISVDEGELAQALQHTKRCLGRPAVGANPHLLAIVRVSSDRHIDQALVFADPAVHQQRVALLGGATLQLLL